VKAEEEDESTLFMASAAVIEPVAAHAHPSAVHLDDGTRWILDSGATNHMTGVHSVL
jgi:hypothetical protein